MDLQTIGRDDVDCIHLTRDSVGELLLWTR